MVPGALGMVAFFFFPRKRWYCLELSPTAFLGDLSDQDPLGGESSEGPRAETVSAGALCSPGARGGGLMAHGSISSLDPPCPPPPARRKEPHVKNNKE